MKRAILLLALIWPGVSGATTGSQLEQYCAQSDRVSQRATDVDIADVYHAGLCDGYINGVYEANSRFLCVPIGVKVGQIVKVGKKYLRDHPEQLHEDADSLVTRAIIKAFPCNK